MKIIHAYDIEIKQWEHEPVEKFYGENLDSLLSKE